MPDISSPPERTEELVEQVRSAIWCEIEKQTGGNWPVELGNGDLVDATLDLTALSRAALQSLGYAEMERENARLRTQIEVAAVIFDEYGRLHRKKGTAEGDLKAERNEQYAAEMRTALRGDQEQGEG